MKLSSARARKAAPSRTCIVVAAGVFALFGLLTLGGAFTGAPVESTSFVTMSASSSLGFAFEVWGKVRGVWFRKYTQKRANELGLMGWVRNTSRGTVEGEVAGGTQQSRNQMKEWLQTVGSPKSHIDRADFRPLDDSQAESVGASGVFEVRHTSR